MRKKLVEDTIQTQQKKTTKFKEKRDKVMKFEPVSPMIFENSNAEALEIIQKSTTKPLPDILGSGNQPWSKEEKILYLDLVRKYGKDYHKIGQIMTSRTI